MKRKEFRSYVCTRNIPEIHPAYNNYYSACICTGFFFQRIARIGGPDELRGLLSQVSLIQPLLDKESREVVQQRNAPVYAKEEL